MFLIYILRNDLRVADNPIFHAILTRAKPFSHVLPIFILPPSRIEVSGLATEKSPYPDARSRLGNFWRCGPHRVKFLAEAIFDVRSSLRSMGSDLVIRVGPMDVVLHHLLKSDAFRGKSGAVWMTRDWATEEMAEERRIRNVVQSQGGNVEWKVWDGEDTLIHDNDLPVRPSQLPYVFTSFRKSVEPLREHVRQPLSLPPSARLPPLPENIPGQVAPFTIPDSLPELITALQKPLVPVKPVPDHTAHPFIGGESHARKRVLHLLSSGAMSRYKDTRNGLLGEDFSTKLSGYLGLGCITARQINELVVAFEDGNMPSASSAIGYGKGENKGTSAVRFELLWRDYMSLCMRKYGASLFSVYGFRGAQQGRPGQSNWQWKSPSADMETAKKFERFLDGTTGIGLIDASMRELALTGYTSNRARQNCASFLATWLEIDWRLGAEWYESMLVDYDVANNWGNWQYVAGVGNDPRGSEDGRARRFNPVKQSWDYDKKGEYVKAWVPEVAEVEDVDAVFQPWKLLQNRRLGKQAESLRDLPMVKDPLVKIHYQKRK